MIYKIVRSILLMAILQYCCNCFAQTNETYFIIDTIGYKDFSVNSSFDNYNDFIIRCKTFYDFKKKKLHTEFIRIEPGKYYCLEYDTSGVRINYGVAKIEIQSFEIEELPVFDSTGAIVSIDSVHLFKFLKDETWHELISENGKNYILGGY